MLRLTDWLMIRKYLHMNLTFTPVPISKWYQVRNGHNKRRGNRDRRSSGLIRINFRLSITCMCDYWFVEFLWFSFEINLMFGKKFHDWVLDNLRNQILLFVSRQWSHLFFSKPKRHLQHPLCIELVLRTTAWLLKSVGRSFWKRDD